MTYGRTGFRRNATWLAARHSCLTTADINNCVAVHYSLYRHFASAHMTLPHHVPSAAFSTLADRMGRMDGTVSLFFWTSCSDTWLGYLHFTLCAFSTSIARHPWRHRARFSALLSTCRRDAVERSPNLSPTTPYLLHHLPGLTFYSFSLAREPRT